MTATGYLRFVACAVVGICPLPRASADSAVEVTVIADTSQPVAGGLYRFESFRKPHIDESGRACFLAKTADTSDAGNPAVDSIWCGDGQSLELIARVGGEPDGMEPGTRFEDLVHPPILSSGGTVAYTGRTSLPSGARADGVWYGDNLLQDGDPAPGIDGATFKYLHGRSIGINAAGDLGLLGLYTFDGANILNGIWAQRALALDVVAAADIVPVPGIPDATFNRFDAAPAINDTGWVSFTATVSGPGIYSDRDTGLWLFGPDGGVLVARENEKPPGEFGFRTFGDMRQVRPMLNNRGDVAFAADVMEFNRFIHRAMWERKDETLTRVAFVSSIAPGPPLLMASGDVVYRSSSAIVSKDRGLLLRDGDPVGGDEGDLTFHRFGLPKANTQERLAFIARLAGPNVTSENEVAVFVEDADGNYRCTLRYGQALEMAPGDTRTVSGLDVFDGGGGEDGRGNAFNSGGQLALQASFTDGSAAILVVRPLPDCNGNGIPDDVEIAKGLSNDCNGNGVPDDCDEDSDGDGIPNDCDACPDSPTDDTLLIAGCDTGVVDFTFDDGCKLGDGMAPCVMVVRKHGQFVMCVAHVARSWRMDGVISGAEYGAIMSCAGGTRPDSWYPTVWPGAKRASHGR